VGVRGAGPAALELVYELCEFLSRKYPSLYSVTRASGANGGANGWYGEGEIREVEILPTGEKFNLEKEDPLRVAAML
jgi:hypothetical protein